MRCVSSVHTSIQTHLCPKTNLGDVDDEELPLVVEHVILRQVPVHEPAAVVEAAHVAVCVGVYM